MAKHIVVIPGDGIGEEITAGAVKVLQKIDEVCHIGLTFEKKPAGGTAYDLCGSPLPKIRSKRLRRPMPSSSAPSAATSGITSTRNCDPNRLS